MLLGGSRDDNLPCHANSRPPTGRLQLQHRGRLKILEMHMFVLALKDPNRPFPTNQPSCLTETYVLHSPIVPRNEGVLALKDPNRPFPTGAPLGVLKWRLQVGGCGRSAAKGLLVRS